MSVKGTFFVNGEPLAEGEVEWEESNFAWMIKLSMVENTGKKWQRDEARHNSRHGRIRADRHVPRSA